MSWGSTDQAEWMACWDSSYMRNFLSPCRFWDKTVCFEEAMDEDKLSGLPGHEVSSVTDLAACGSVFGLDLSIGCSCKPLEELEGRQVAPRPRILLMERFLFVHSHIPRITFPGLGPDYGSASGLSHGCDGDEASCKSWEANWWYGG